MRTIELGQTTYFHFPANNTAGTGDDGATAVFDVRLGGAAASAAPVISGSGALLSHVDYPAGCYEVAVVATAGNGFAAGQEYAVFATLAVDAQNPTGLIGSFQTESAGDVTAHFTNRTTDGNSTVQSLSGDYSIHIEGTFGTATLEMFGGTTGSDPSTFTKMREFSQGQAPINIKFSGDVRFTVASSNGSTSITAILQEIV